jgi:uncharacterized membrane protein
MMPGFVHWPGLLGLVFTLLTILALVGVVPLAIGLAAKPDKPAGRATSTAEDELRVRYAKGDIDAAELNERLAALRATERVS